MNYPSPLLVWLALILAVVALILVIIFFIVLWLKVRKIDKFAKEGTVEALTTRITVVENDVKQAKSDVTTLQADVTGVEGDVATLQTDVTTLKTDVAGVVTTGEFPFTITEGYTAPVSGTAEWFKIQSGNSDDFLVAIKFNGFLGSTAAVAPPYLGTAAGTVPVEIRPAQLVNHEMLVMMGGVSQTTMGVLSLLADGTFRLFRDNFGTPWSASQAITGTASVWFSFALNDSD